MLKKPLRKSKHRNMKINIGQMKSGKHEHRMQEKGQLNKWKILNT